MKTTEIILLAMNILLILYLVISMIFESLKVEVFKADDGRIMWKLTLRNPKLWKESERANGIRLIDLEEKDFVVFATYEKSMEKLVSEYESVANRRMRDIMKSLWRYEA